MMVDEPVEAGLSVWDRMEDPFHLAMYLMPAKAIARLKLAAKGSAEIASAFTEGRLDPFWLYPYQIAATHPESIVCQAWGMPSLMQMFRVRALDRLRSLYMSMDVVDTGLRAAFWSALAAISPQLETLELSDGANGQHVAEGVTFAWSALRNLSTTHGVYRALLSRALLLPPLPRLEYLKIDAMALPLNLKDDAPILQQVSISCDVGAFWNTLTLPASLRVFHLTSAEPTTIVRRHADVIAACMGLLESSDVSSGIEILSLDLPLNWGIGHLSAKKWPRLSKIRIQPFPAFFALLDPVKAQLSQVVTLRANQFHPDEKLTRFAASIFAFRTWPSNSLQAPMVAFYKYDVSKESRTVRMYKPNEGEHIPVQCSPSRAREVLRKLNRPGVENILQLEDSRNPMLFPHDRIGTLVSEAPQ